MILTIARREFQAAFLSPLAWGLLAANQGLLAWVFLRVLERFSGLEVAARNTGLSAELSLNLFGFAAVLLLLSVPPLAMRTLSGERREGTFELLAAAPVSLTGILLGKYLGMLGILTVLALPPPVMALALSGFAELDLGRLAAAALGVWLCGGLFAAIGLFASSLTAQPGLAAGIAYSLLILLSVLGDTGGESAGTLFAWLSWNEHLFWFLLGTVRPADLIYLALLSTFFLALAHRGLANARLDGSA